MPRPNFPLSSTSDKEPTRIVLSSVVYAVGITSNSVSDILTLIVVIAIPRKEGRNGPYYSFQHVIHIYAVMWVSLDEDV